MGDNPNSSHTEMEDTTLASSPIEPYLDELHRGALGDLYDATLSSP
jgi:hypothetical protein